MLDKNHSWFEKFVRIIFLIIMIWNLGWLLLGSSEAWVSKQSFDLSSGAILIAFLLGLLVWQLKKRICIEPFLNRYATIIVPILTTVLLLFQLVYSYYACFYTDWDSEALLRSATLMAEENYAGLNEQFAWYYSQFPSYIVLTWIYSIIIRIGSILSISPLYSLIIAQCIGSAVAAWLIFSTCLKIVSSYTISLSVWIVYTIFIGTSPWVMIPYSDATYLVFPVLILWLYVDKKQGKSNIARWALIGILTVVGFECKPQVAILSIAIWMTDFAQIAKGGIFNEKVLITLKRIVAFVIACVLTATVIEKVIIPGARLTLNEERTFGPTHFVMMGLNEDYNGVWNPTDYDFSASCATVAERKEGNIHVILERLSEMKLNGLLKHLGKKTLTNYGDGSFAWEKEGVFYLNLIPDRDKFLSPFFKNIFYSNGKYYSFSMTGRQIIWLGLLMGGIGVLRIFKKRPSIEISVVLLSIIGLTLFELIFEARARYLYIYSPFYILVGVIGWASFLTPTVNKIQRTTDQQIGESCPTKDGGMFDTDTKM